MLDLGFSIAWPLREIVRKYQSPTARMDSDETSDWRNEINWNAGFDKSAANAPLLRWREACP
jgi:hypothetical protein